MCLITCQRIGSLSNVTEPRAPRWSCVVGLMIFIVGRFFCHVYVCLDVCCSLCWPWNPFQVVAMGVQETCTFFPFSFCALYSFRPINRPSLDIFFVIGYNFFFFTFLRWSVALFPVVNRRSLCFRLRLRWLVHFISCFLFSWSVQDRHCEGTLCVNR